MPRKNRRESRTEVYHIIARGNNKEKIFEKNSDKIAFMNILKKRVREMKIYSIFDDFGNEPVEILKEAGVNIKLHPSGIERPDSTQIKKNPTGI